MRKNYNYTKLRPEPNRALKDSIIANACKHFGISAESLLTAKRRGCMMTMAIAYVVYKEANYTHQLASELFGYSFPQYSFRAMLKVEYMIRRKRKESAAIVAFYKEYGYCKHLWEVEEKKAAAIIKQQQPCIRNGNAI